MNDIDRAVHYLAAVPGSSEGGRNDALNRAAYKIRERFPSLSQGEFVAILARWASDNLVPQLPQEEIEKTIDSAWTGAANRGTVGSKATAPRDGARPASARPAIPKTMPAPAAAPAAPPPVYDYDTVDRLPDPIENGAAELFRLVFRPDEGVRIAQGRIGDDGKEIPKDEGMVLSAKTWVEKFNEKGGPGGVWSSSKGAGVFVTVNPMKAGGAKDADVTAFRHALIEIDHGLTPVQQWGLWTASDLPCAAIISSGRKSVHAWVKIDAKDRAEYDERVAFLHAHFAAYNIDRANKNPSRFSRLPDVKRGSGRQELLALNVGAASWTEWIKKLEGDALGKSVGLGDLLDLDTDHDPNNILGFRDGKTLRYLCKGKSAWLLGPSGIGKSSLITEFAVGWAMGQPVYGITPARPLRSLIVQAENDQHDLAEMAQGIARAYNLLPFSDALEAVSANVRFRTETRAVGQALMDRLHRMIDADRPDVIWMDPLLSFAGIDVSKQDQVTTFLRTIVNPVLEATGVVLFGVHHTGKPKSAKETAGWTAIDWAYSGLGSSELVNWARAVMLLRPTGDHEFQLMLAKRGRRAGATHPDGEPTTVVWLKHAAHGIRWEQVQPPEEAPEGQDSGKDAPGRQERTGKRQDAKPGAPSKASQTFAWPWIDFTSQLPAEGVSGHKLWELASSWMETTGRRPIISKRTFDSEVRPVLAENGIRLRSFQGRYFPPNSTPLQ